MVELPSSSQMLPSPAQPQRSGEVVASGGVSYDDMLRQLQKNLVQCQQDLLSEREARRKLEDKISVLQGMATPALDSHRDPVERQESLEQTHIEPQPLEKPEAQPSLEPQPVAEPVARPVARAVLQPLARLAYPRVAPRPAPPTVETNLADLVAETVKETVARVGSADVEPDARKSDGFSPGMLKDEIGRIESRGNIKVDLATGSIQLLKPLLFPKRLLRSEPVAEFEQPNVANAICRDLAGVCTVLERPMRVQAHIKGKESRFWQELVDSRAQLVADLIVKLGADHEKIRCEGRPGRSGLNESRIVVFLETEDIVSLSLQTEKALSSPPSETNLFKQRRKTSSPRGLRAMPSQVSTNDGSRAAR